jgi:hypothetical protein
MLTNSTADREKWSNDDGLCLMKERSTLDRSGVSVARGIRDRISEFAKLIRGGDAAASVMPPPSGTDTTSKRQFLALFLITMTIMAIGIVVALTWENKSSNATNSPIVAATQTPG